MQEKIGFGQATEFSATPRVGRTTDHSCLSQSAEDLISLYGRSKAFVGHRIAITGTLRRGQRTAVQSLISAIGATPEKSLTKKTTILIAGIPNPSSFAEGSSASQKLEKAEKLRASGSTIQVVTEEEFFNRLTDELP